MHLKMALTENGCFLNFIFFASTHSILTRLTQRLHGLDSIYFDSFDSAKVDSFDSLTKSTGIVAHQLDSLV